MLKLKTVIAAVVAIYGGAFADASLAALPAALGWYEMPNTRLISVCAAENGFPQIGGATGCTAITQAWNGGVFDTSRNRLIIWGGGHNDYYGNEIYAVNLNTETIERLTDPGLPAATSAQCVEAIANGAQANSRHTYDGIEYVPGADKMFVFGGSLACGVGAFGRDTWLFDFAAKTWQRKNPTGVIPNAVAGILTAHDKVSGLVYLHDNAHFYSYDVNADRYTQLSTTQQSVGYHLNATIDPVRRKFIIAGYDNIQGGGVVWSIDIGSGSNYQMQPVSTSGGSELLNSNYPGIEYDPVTDRIVGWNERAPNVVYSLNPDTRLWTAATYAGGPTPISGGTHGRWRYSPASNVFVLANSVDNNVVVFRASAGTGTGGGGGGGSGTTTPDADYAARCSAAGVIKCVGFDNVTTDIVRNVNVWPDGLGVFRADLDTNNKISGAGSLRFDLPPPPHAGQNISGRWSPEAQPVFGRVFSENSTFYVQYRLRLSDAMVTDAFSNSTWKTSIFHYANKSCASIELTTSNYYGMPMAQMNTDCGGRGMWSTLDGSQYVNQPPMLMQQSDSMQCSYGSGYTSPKCALYAANEWLTLYYKVHIGVWDQPNSSVEAWLAHEGFGYERFVRMMNLPLSCNGESCTVSPYKEQGYNNITFTPYMTGLLPTVGPGSTAHMWIDELIISDQPIAAPDGGNKPQAPSNFAVR